MTAIANTIRLKVTKPHATQEEILKGATRFNVVCAGRRTGKSRLALIRSLDYILNGKPVAYFAPIYRMMSEFWREAVELYRPIISTLNKSEHFFQTLTGGSFQMWSLDSAETIRGRKYALALIDEAAMVADLENAWNAVIRPTLADYEGGADFYSTPKGLNYFHLLFARGQDLTFPDWSSFQFPTSANPFIKESEIEAARQELPEDVFRQEFLAQFIQGEGSVFRNITANLTSIETTPDQHAGHLLYAGGDWGQVNDFTAISVGCKTCAREVELVRFNKIDWEFQRSKALALLDKWNVKIALFEENSIGSPNLEALQKSTRRDIRGFMTTAQTKSPLIQSLALALEQNEMTFLDIPIATRELEAYEAKKSELTGRISYNAPKGFHDDTVIARALMREAMNQLVFEPKRSTTRQTYW